jgi:hypothetical protein
MPRSAIHDSGRVDLNQVFQTMQRRMRALLDVGGALEHPSACGAAGELQWLHLLNCHLPERYRASSAFIVDARGNRSRQIDIAIYDRFYSPLIFPYEGGILIPAESVYAVFEVKQVLTRQYVRDAGIKVASVRRLKRTTVPIPATATGDCPAKPPFRILTGVLANKSVWKEKDFVANLTSALAQLTPDQSLDLGCILHQAAFQCVPRPRRRRHNLKLSTADDSLVFFLFHFLDRLRALGTAPALNFLAYARSLKSKSSTNPTP